MRGNKELKNRLILKPFDVSLIYQLTPFLPEGLAPVAANWIKTKKVTITITPPRRTLMGDFRPAIHTDAHRISVSSGLNPYSFLITFVHEFAHLAVWEKFKHKVTPHGNAWQYAFQHLLSKFLEHPIFPLDVEKALTKHLERPPSSTCYDAQLYKTLLRYDGTPQITIEHIKPGLKFKDNQGRIFIRGHKIRVNYACTLEGTKHVYRFPPMYPVIPIL